MSAPRRSLDGWYITLLVLIVLGWVWSVRSVMPTPAELPVFDPARAATCRVLHTIAVNRRERELAMLGCRPGVNPDVFLPDYEGTTCALRLLYAKEGRP